MPKRTNEGATRATTAPLETTVAEDAPPVSARERHRVVGTPRAPIASEAMNSRREERRTAAVAVAGVGGRTGALELEVDAGVLGRSSGGTHRGHGAAVAELPGPLAELVAAVVLRVGAARAG